MECPLCEGCGQIRVNPTAETIKQLRIKGLTVREIAKVINKGSTTVHYHIHKRSKR